MTNDEQRADDERVQVRLSRALAVRLDERLAAARAAMPGANLTRADMIRTLVVQALDTNKERTP